MLIIWMQLYECDARVCGAREVSNSLPKFETEVGTHEACFFYHIVCR
jgi:hypothetical protein